MSVSSKPSVLSCSGMSAQLKDGKFNACWDAVERHLKQNPADQEGIAKFMSSVNVFIFNRQ